MALGHGTPPQPLTAAGVSGVSVAGRTSVPGGAAYAARRACCLRQRGRTVSRTLSPLPTSPHDHLSEGTTSPRFSGATSRPSAFEAGPPPTPNAPPVARGPLPCRPPSCSRAGPGPTGRSWVTGRPCVARPSGRGLLRFPRRAWRCPLAFTAHDGRTGSRRPGAGRSRCHHPLLTRVHASDPARPLRAHLHVSERAGPRGSGAAAQTVGARGVGGRCRARTPPGRYEPVGWPCSRPVVAGGPGAPAFLARTRSACSWSPPRSPAVGGLRLAVDVARRQPGLPRTGDERVGVPTVWTPTDEWAACCSWATAPLARLVWLTTPTPHRGVRRAGDLEEGGGRAADGEFWMAASGPGRRRPAR